MVSAASSSVDSTSSPPCLGTTTEVLLDGANSVCGSSRRWSEGQEGSVGVLQGAVVLAVALAVGGGRRRWAMRNLAFVVALGGLLGWSAFLSRRADGPSRMAETAQEVRGLYEALDAFVQENQGCVDVDLEACEACQPIVRMALPTGKTCATARARVVLEANAIGGACRRTPEELTCGDRP